MENNIQSDNIVAARSKKKSSPFNNKYLVYGLCGLGSAIVIAVIVWGVLSILNKPPLDDSYFVSDDTKTTISLNPDSETSALHQTHVVYEYDGDNVVGMKTYFEYPDAQSASAAYESLKDQPEFKNSEVKDKYIIVTADESQFKGLTASDVRQQAEAIKAYQESQKKDKSTEDETQPEVVPEEEPQE